jgi:hypothetical protein
MDEDLVFALTDLKICTIGLCATIVLCAVGLGLPRPATDRHPHQSSDLMFYQFRSQRSDGRIADRLAQLQTEHRTEGWQQRNCPHDPGSRHDTWGLVFIT